MRDKSRLLRISMMVVVEHGAAYAVNLKVLAKGSRDTKASDLTVHRPVGMEFLISRLYSADGCFSVRTRSVPILRPPLRLR